MGRVYTCMKCKLVNSMEQILVPIWDTKLPPLAEPED
jgi:hypothetical protein